MPRYNSGRKKLPPGDKRVFFRVSIQEKYLNAFDQVIKEMNENSSYAEINRTTITEGLILEFLRIQKEGAAK